MFLSVWLSHNSHIVFYLITLVILVTYTYAYNCKKSGVYMVWVCGLVVITCIINGPFDNESTRTSNWHVTCTMVRKYPPNPRGTKNVFSDIRFLSIQIYVLSLSCLAIGINLVRDKVPRD